MCRHCLQNISITKTPFRYQPEQLLELHVELELRPVHQTSLSSTKHINCEERSPSTDMQGDSQQQAINRAQRIPEENRDGPWCTGADRDF